MAPRWLRRIPVGLHFFAIVMSDLFSKLGLPVSLLLPRDEVDAAWRELSLSHHPDVRQDTSETGVVEINEARDRLVSPSGRLAEWLRVRTGKKAGGTALVAGGLLALFSAIGDLLQRADGIISKAESCQTSLGRAMLAKELVAMQMEIQERLGELGRETDSILSRFPDFEKQAEEGVFSEAEHALAELRFLDKWEKECQRRLLTLIAID